MLRLCEVLHHQAPPPPPPPASSTGIQAVNLEDVVQELLEFRKFALACDKFLMVSIFTHFSLNWLSAFLRIADCPTNERATTESHGQHIRIRVGICELACLLKDEMSFQRATELLLKYSCNRRGLADWEEELSKVHDLLPEHFFGKDGSLHAPHPF
jgi:hypothetical protein